MRRSLRRRVMLVKWLSVHSKRPWILASLHAELMIGQVKLWPSEWIVIISNSEAKSHSVCGMLQSVLVSRTISSVNTTGSGFPLAAHPEDETPIGCGS
ncbi:hypothetical protein SDJN03_30182, partial [Cucurbita argyrosperma subsp. sororia]